MLELASPKSYLGKEIFVGIDVHKKSYSLTAICERQIVKKATVKADPRQVSESLKKWFVGGSIKSCYEAGFSGYALHRTLVGGGIKNIVVNAASIAVAANDKVKTDLRDSKKMAQDLSDNRLNGIYIPTPEEEARRSLTRTREQVVDTRATIARQIKAKLHYFGLMNPDDDRLISNRYLKEIENLKLAEDIKFSFGLLIEQWRFLTLQLFKVRKMMLKQAGECSEIEKIYRSVPGVGEVSARVLANELGDMSRFKNARSLFSYLGLTPSERSSGEKVRQGNISRQGSARLRQMLVEVAWRAITQDPALKQNFERIAGTRGKKKAIVAVARNLSGRIRSCLKNNKPYALETYK